MISFDAWKVNSLRPFVWGFFISGFLLLVGITYRWVLAERLESQKEQILAARIHEQSAIVKARFDREKSELLRKAVSVAGELTLPQHLKENTPQAVLAVFEGLAKFRGETDVTIEISDPRGTIIAWSGSRILEDSQKLLASEERDTIAAIIHDPLHTHLIVGVQIPSEHFYVFVGSPLERNYPLSSRFVPSRSFVRQTQIETGIGIRVLLTDTTNEPHTSHLVSLDDFTGETIGFALLNPATVEDLYEEIDRTSSLLITGGLGLIFLFVGCVSVFFARRVKNDSVKTLAFLLAVWGVRYLWVVIGFPSKIVEGRLFDPSVYSSPFGFGLATTLGDLLLSVLALGISAVLAFRVEWKWLMEEKTLWLPTRSKILLSVILLALGLGVCFLVRAYGAAVRSFVFDSTLAFHDPTELLPGVELALMHGSLMILSLICIAISVAVVRFMHLLASPLHANNRARVAVAFWLFLGLALFLLLDKQQQLPPIWMFLLIVMFYVAGTFVTAIKSARRWSIVLTLLGFSFLFCAFVLDRKLHEKERVRLQLMGEELLRPADSWLAFVAEHSLKRIQQEYLAMQEERGGGTVEEKKLAFRLWATTLLSQRNYNSTIVVYDRMGKETSRFAVGIASYEQSEFLQKLFDEDEEAVYAFPLDVPATDRYYGTWATIRDEDNELHGFVAILLSKPEGADHQIQLLGSSLTIDRIPSVRRTYVVRYQNGAVVESMFPDIVVGSRLASDVEKAMSEETTRMIWRDEYLGDQAFESLYIRNQNDLSESVSVLVERLDMRWHIFNLLKMAFVYVFVLFVLIVLVLTGLLLRRGMKAFGFRERLVVVLSAAVIIPIIILAYYNRTLAEEKAKENRTRELQRQLTLVGRHIDSALMSEEDFRKGMTDDFCSAVARDLGIEFTVFKGSELLSSSRRELYDAELLESRLAGTAFANTVVLGKEFYQEIERIGELEYAVGYRPVVFNGRVLGVISVSTLHRQQEIEAEIIERNAFTVGVNAVVLLLVIGVGLIVVHRLSQPLRVLRDAAHEVGKGKLDVAVPVTTTDEIGELVTSFNDMTERLRKSRSELVRVERELAWKEMAKQVAHEIKNPLTPMRLAVQHLQQAFRDKAPELDSIVRKVTSTIIEQIDTLARIATEFSNFARMPERRFERVDLHALIEETVVLFRSIEGVEFRVKFSDTNPQVVADKDELRRVFVNIFRNSIQAMNEGGRITISTEVSGTKCNISISDTGAGIPGELLEKVFHPNFSTKTDGMGIGLAITRKIVEDLDGSIALESSVGVGTTITITLPHNV